METALPPQPPPDAPEPLPGDEAVDSQIKMKIIWVIGGVAVAFALFYLTISLPLSQRSARKLNAHSRSEAASNLCQLHLALLDFANDYGAFPDASTISDVKLYTGTTLTLGNGSSNELFRQLLASETVKSESIFWARTRATPTRPNNILGADALMKGECAFTYIAGLSPTSDPAAPVAMAPLIPGTWEFDPKPFGGKAVVLRVNGSVKPEVIDTHGHVIIGGMNLLDPRQPYWHGKTPDIKWPE